MLGCMDHWHTHYFLNLGRVTFEVSGERRKPEKLVTRVHCQCAVKIGTIVCGHSFCFLF